MSLTKVLVTGGAGFIGSHTVDLLVDKGYDVRVLDNLEPQAHSSHLPSHLDTRAEFIEGDIRNIDVWRKSLSDVEYVVHLAGVVGIAQSMEQPLRYLDVNCLGTAAFYEALLKGPRNRIRKIVVASSKTIYGEGAYVCKTHGLVYPGIRRLDRLRRKIWDVSCPVCDSRCCPTGITEDKPPQKLSVYAVSKYAVERMALLYGHALEIPTVTLRYFSAYGPRQSLENPYSGVSAIFLRRIMSGEPPRVFEDGRQLRDFVYVLDIARANALALEIGEETDCYNIGSGVPVSILDLANCLSNLTGIRLEPCITKEFRLGDTRSDFADISKATRALGFKPHWTLKQGLEELVKWAMGTWKR